MQRSLLLDEPAATAIAVAGAADEAAWIESRRGRPLLRAGAAAPAVEHVFGRTFADAVPTDDEWRALLHPDDAAAAAAGLAEARRGAAVRSTYRIVLPDGTYRSLRDRVLHLDDRWQLRLVGIATPPWLDRALDLALLLCDHGGRIVEAHGPVELMPLLPEALIGHAIAHVSTLPAAMRDAWTTALDRALDTQRPQICAYRLEADAGPQAFEARMLPLAPGSAVIAIRDVGERDRLRERLAHHAVTDELTGLVNARGLRETLDAWLRPATRADAGPVALLLVDLDRFKQSNDLHGRAIGDTLLRLVAQRIGRETEREVRGVAMDLRDTERSSELDAPVERRDGAGGPVVARVGGDQFAVAWRPDRGSDVAARSEALAARLVAVLGVPTRIAGQSLFVRASVGIATWDGDASDPVAAAHAADATSLFSQADAALKRAKGAGRNQVRRHRDDAAPAGAVAPSPYRESTLRDALAAGQFTLVYQPKFELASSLSERHDDGERPALAPGAVIAVEALVRWRLPGGAVLLPREFLPLAESSGMILPLGDHVLRTALAETGRFAADGAVDVGLALNVSLRQLHDRVFVRTVEAALREAGRDPRTLTIEIAETAFVEDVRLAADALAELSALGVRLAIDHFGVGTAGLVALRSLPVDEIKIDRSFVAGAAIDAFDATIIAGLIHMAHNLGKTVTAEGVERVDQIASLAQMRCDAIQGYFVGEPLPAAALVAAEALWRGSRDARTAG